jgi:riboflavin kinase/FMN adenylyltransferase
LHDQLLAPVSSSAVRWLVSLGRVADAALCLASHFALDAKVVQGEQRGRTIGVPTINLDPADLQGRVLPADGVYAGWCDLPGQPGVPAAISLGIKPTFGQRRRVVEAHLLDFAGNLYERRVTLRFARWVRDQQAFPALPMLVDQIRRDVAQVRAWHERGLLDTLPVARRAS